MSPPDGARPAFGPEPPPRPWTRQNSSLPTRQNRASAPAMLPVLDVYTNAVYYPNWSVRKEPPSSLKLNIISHVLYAFAWVGPTGNVELSDPVVDTQMTVDGQPGALGAFASLKRQHHYLKLILSIGGYGRGSKFFPAVARDAGCRLNFAKSAAALVQKYGLDGIDVDWEYPEGPGQGSNFLQLILKVRDLLPYPRYILTAALPASEWYLKNIDLPRCQLHLNYINLMAYDFAGSWTETSGHQAQLRTPRQPNEQSKVSGQSAVEYLLRRGVPAYKILLGIPVYGRSFLGAKSVGQRYTGCGGVDGAFDFRQLPRPGTLEEVDREVGAAYCVGGDGGFVSYDNPDTVKMKAAYVASKHLGGLFYWTGTTDARDRRSLVQAGYSELAAHI